MVAGIKEYNMTSHGTTEPKPRTAGRSGVSDPVRSWKERLPRLTESDLAYLSGLYEQYRSGGKTVFRIGADFRPSALLSASERRDLLGAVDYAELSRDREEYERAARSVALTLNPMNGGIGSSVGREAYLSALWKELGRSGPVVLGAKGSDLYFPAGPGRKISISQAKILRAVRESGFYRELRIQQLASTETLESIRLFTEEPSPLGKTYRRLIEEKANMRWMEPLLQAALPTVDSEGNLTDRRTVPGGHGQWGVHLLLQSLRAEPGTVSIHAIYNEDGINNTVDPVIVGWMARERVPIVMITTTKTPLDRKGGLLGVARTPSGGFRKEMMEKAQADAAGQSELFADMGLTQGEAGAQYFNTNTALVNYGVLAPFLRDLAGVVGEEELGRIVSPMLIRNKKKQREEGGEREYVQLEGALCSTLLNLDGYLSECGLPEVREVLARHGFLEGGRVRFLRVVNVDAERRTRFFTPVKNAFDFWLQFHSDLFRVNPETWELEALRPGLVPEVELSGEYSDVSRVLDCFSGAKIRELKSLSISGPVRLAGAELKGTIRIENRSPSAADFNDPALRSRTGLPAGERLELEDFSIVLREDGGIRRG